MVCFYIDLAYIYILHVKQQNIPPNKNGSTELIHLMYFTHILQQNTKHNDL